MALLGVQQKMARFLAYSLGAALLLGGCALAPEPYGAYYGAYSPAYPDYYGPPVFYGYGCCAGEFRRHEHEHHHDEHGHFDAAQRHAAPAVSGSSMPHPVHQAGGGAAAAAHHAPSHAPGGRGHEEHH